MKLLVNICLVVIFSSSCGAILAQQAETSSITNQTDVARPRPIIFPPTSNSSASTMTSRDSKAVEVIELAIQALGGRSRIEGIDGCRSEGVQQRLGKTISIVRTDQAGNFRYDYATADGPVSIVSANGRRTRSAKGQWRQLPGIDSAMRMEPHLLAPMLLRRYIDSSISIQSIAGSSTDHIVRFSKLSKRTRLAETEDWYFDSKTHLPSILQSAVPTLSSVANRFTVATSFSGYESVDGLLIAQHLETSHEGILLFSEDIHSFSCNQQIDSNIFQAGDLQ